MELFSREFGAGAPVIILHGLFGFSDNWQTIAKGLADTHLVVTPDLRNHGRSPHLPTHTYPEMAEDIAANLAQLDMNALKALFRQLLRLDTFEQLEFWITDHLPERTA